MAKGRTKNERYDMSARKTPIYSMDNGLTEWLELNGGIMYTEVLESIEAALIGERSFTAIPVIILKSESGATLFIIKSIDATCESLDKAKNWFINTEEYEKAARARDAITAIETIKEC